MQLNIQLIYRIKSFYSSRVIPHWSIKFSTTIVQKFKRYISKFGLNDSFFSILYLYTILSHLGVSIRGTKKKKEKEKRFSLLRFSIRV